MRPPFGNMTLKGFASTSGFGKETGYSNGAIYKAAEELYGVNPLPGSAIHTFVLSDLLDAKYTFEYKKGFDEGVFQLHGVPTIKKISTDLIPSFFTNAFEFGVISFLSELRNMPSTEKNSLTYGMLMPYNEPSFSSLGYSIFIKLLLPYKEGCCPVLVFSYYYAVGPLHQYPCFFNTSNTLDIGRSEQVQKNMQLLYEDKFRFTENQQEIVEKLRSTTESNEEMTASLKLISKTVDNRIGDLTKKLVRLTELNPDMQGGSKGRCLVRFLDKMSLISY